MSSFITAYNNYLINRDYYKASFFCCPKTRHKIKLSLNLLNTLEDSQPQTTLLRSCFALPKVVSVLRVGTRSTAHEFSSSIRRALDWVETGRGSLVVNYKGAEGLCVARPVWQAKCNKITTAALDVHVISPLQL